MFKSFLTKMIGEDHQTETSEKVEKIEKADETQKEDESDLGSQNRKMQQEIDCFVMKRVLVTEPICTF